VRRARGVIQDVVHGKEARDKGVSVRLDYVEINDADSFEVVADGEVMRTAIEEGEKDAVILSGAIWVGQTRLIDNVILGNVSKILW
jgi:pantoate--beta-alanine ligase